MIQSREIAHIESQIEKFKQLGRVEILDRIQGSNYNFPLYKISFGSEKPEAPVLGLVGGVHGLERIGSQVVLSLLNSFSNLLSWDKSTRELLQEIRVVFIPAVNPYGLAKLRRANPRGVDLMRNAPLDAETQVPFLVGGQRWGPHLPWYRGEIAQMEKESAALTRAVLDEVSQSRSAVFVDFHSGFGLQDQIWFPHAYSKKIFNEISEFNSLIDLLENAYPHHFYKIEPQAKVYTTHGDLWDYIYLEHQKVSSNLFIPLCLEMGSWSWVKKNPLQLFRSDGIFNPVKKHRLQRTLRRHNTLFEFLLKATRNHSVWSQLTEEQKRISKEKAIQRWYHE